MHGTRNLNRTSWCGAERGWSARLAAPPSSGGRNLKDTTSSVSITLTKDGEVIIVKNKYKAQRIYHRLSPPTSTRHYRLTRTAKKTAKVNHPSQTRTSDQKARKPRIGEDMKSFI